MQDIDTEEGLLHEQDEVKSTVKKYFAESQGYKKNYEKDWKLFEQFYDGKQWQFSDGVRPVKNLLFKTIEGQLPLLTDARPSVDVVPIEESSFDKAKMLSSALTYVFEKQNLQLKNVQVFRTILKTGTAFLYVDYDPDLDQGAGDIVIKELDWRFCFPDPNAKEIDECLYFGIKMPIRAIDAERKFPAFKEEIEKSKSGAERDEVKINEFLKEDRWDGYGGLTNEKASYKLEDMVDYSEMWHKDYETVPVDPEETVSEIAKEAEEFMLGKAPDITQYEDHDSHIAAHEEFKQVFLIETASKMLGLMPEQVTENDVAQISQLPEVALILSLVDDHIEAHNEYSKINPSGEKPKYKNNLRLTIMIGENIVYDDAAPVEDGLIPIAPAYCYKDNKSFWGTGDIKNSIDSQKEHNELGWYELSGLALNQNSGWVVDEEAQVDADTLTNDPGIIIKKRAAGQVQRLPPGEVSVQLGQKQSKNEFEIDSMMGLPEASQGRAPAGFTAARAVVALQQAGNGRSRLKSQMYDDYTLPRLAKLCLSRIIKYWNVEKMLRIYDDNGKIQFIKFDPKDIENFEYDIKVVQGSSLGYDKGQLFEFMSTLVGQGMIPAKVLFQTVDVPYRSKILEVLEQEDQKNLAIQELQMQVAQLTQLLQPANDGQGKK